MTIPCPLTVAAVASAAGVATTASVAVVALARRWRRKDVQTHFLRPELAGGILERVTRHIA